VLANSLGPNRLVILQEILPNATDFGFLVNPGNPNAGPDTAQLAAAARAAGVRLSIAKATQETEIASALVFAASNIRGAIVNPDPFLLAQRNQIASSARRDRIATIFHLRDPVLSGGLMSYGASFIEAHRMAGLYAGRILNGAKPSAHSAETRHFSDLEGNVAGSYAAEVIRLDLLEKFSTYRIVGLRRIGGITGIYAGSNFHLRQ
jgi:ABC-type uncharacterized transport system substrate-binding protein